MKIKEIISEEFYICNEIKVFFYFILEEIFLINKKIFLLLKIRS